MTDDIEKMNQRELEDVIKRYLAAWNARPGESNDFVSGARYNTARDRLKAEFGEVWAIELNEGGKPVYKLTIK